MRFRVLAVAIALVALVAGPAVAVAGCGASTQPNAAQPGATTPSATSTPAPTTSPTPPDVTHEIAGLVAHLPHGSISVAARNLQTGAGFLYGTAGGHTSASIFKVNILQALLLRHQASGQPLSAAESRDANVMIVTSDNESATRLYQDVGGAGGIRAVHQTLGLFCTEPNPHAWGLTTTCAEDQLQLLYQLESASSPLTQASRDYILNLMQNVTPSQRWGVPVVADPGTTYAVKNGWLDLQSGRDWVVNSIGIVTYKGDTLLIATLSMNGHSMESGIALDEHLARLAAQAVTVP